MTLAGPKKLFCLRGVGGPPYPPNAKKNPVPTWHGTCLLQLDFRNLLERKSEENVRRARSLFVGFNGLELVLGRFATVHKILDRNLSLRARAAGKVTVAVLGVADVSVCDPLIPRRLACRNLTPCGELVSVSTRTSELKVLERSGLGDPLGKRVKRHATATANLQVGFALRDDSGNDVSGAETLQDVFNSDRLHEEEGIRIPSECKQK